MELVKILRELSRRKAMVAVVLVFASVVGLMLAFKPGLPPKSRQYEVSLSAADLLVDTRDSQVAAVTGTEPDLSTLAARANLIGNLMTGGPLKEAIAESSGIPAGRLVVQPPSNPLSPNVPAAPVRPPQSRGVPDAETTSISLSTDATLPILHIVAQAPTPEEAEALTSGAVTQIKKYVGSVVAAQKVPAIHQLVIRELGAPVAETAIRGLPRRYAVFAFLGILVFGCAAILICSWFMRSWRQIEAEEDHGGDGGATLREPKHPRETDEHPAGDPAVSEHPRSTLVRFPL